MKSQITMKDMAQHFGVSLNTIHKAISGKPGVSEDTRKKIMNYADANGYKRNAMAAYLKRKDMVIAVCLPELDSDSRFFYCDIWRGYREYMRDWEDLNLQVQEIPFCKGKLLEALQILEQKCEGEHRIDGLLTVPPREEQEIHILRKLKDKGVSVVLTTGDNPECGRLGCVMADYYTAGALMAEQAVNILRGQGNILLLAGDEYKDAHYLVAKGFHEGVRKQKGTYHIHNLYGCYDNNHWDDSLFTLLKKQTPDIVCCVFARGSAVLYKALRESGIAGRIPVIANDVFEESVKALKDGTFTNLVYKDPDRQAYLAMKMLSEYLVKGMEPSEEVKKVEISLIFRGNLKYYWKE